MADRLVVGKANDGTSDVYGLWVSKPGVDVINGSGVLTSTRNLLFDSRNAYGQVLASGAVSVPGDGTVQINFNARNGQIPPLFWWRASDTILTNVDTNYNIKITATLNVTGNSGSLTFQNNEDNAISVGYILLALDE